MTEPLASIPSEKSSLTIGGINMPMSPNESLLLRLMLASPGRVFTKRELLSAITTERGEPGYKIIDVYLHHIRASLKKYDPKTQITLMDELTKDGPTVSLGWPVLNSFWGLGVSVTYGPNEAPYSGQRWTAAQKRAIGQAFAMNKLSRDEITKNYPEVTDYMLDRWVSGSVYETYNEADPFRDQI
jgi:hypothetical protein